MDKREYLRVVQVGTSPSCLAGLRYYTDFHITYDMIDRKLDAREATKQWKEKSKRKPKKFIGPKFFTKLSFMPAVTIEVTESRSSIRRTCYGFRETLTGERVYLRVETGGIVEFRDHPCGYLIGTRYLIPNVDRMTSHEWHKIDRLLNRLLRKKGIIVTASMVAKWRRSCKPRVKLAKRLIQLRLAYRKKSEYKRKKREKALKQISSRSGIVRDSHSGRPTGPKPERGGLRRANPKPRDKVHTHKSSSVPKRPRRRVDGSRPELQSS